MSFATFSLSYLIQSYITYAYNCIQLLFYNETFKPDLKEKKLRLKFPFPTVYNFIEAEK